MQERRRRLLYWQAATSAQCCQCRPYGKWRTEVWSWPDVTPPWRASLAGCAREGYLQDGCHDVPLSSWSCYLADHFTTSSKVASRLRLRSANRHQLIVPRCRLNTYGRWAFSIAGPTVWNSLPDELRDPACGSDSFKQFLKTILYSLTRVGNLGFIFEFQTFFLIRSWLSPVYNFTTSAIFATSDHFLASVQLTLSVHHLYTQDWVLQFLVGYTPFPNPR